MKKIKGVIVPSHVRSVSDKVVPHKDFVEPDICIYVNARTGNAIMRNAHYMTFYLKRDMSTMNIYNIIPLSKTRFQYVGHSIKFSHQKKGTFPTTIFDIRTMTIGGVASGIRYKR